MHHKLLLIFFLVIVNADLLAQQSKVVHGRISDTSNTALHGATIKLFVEGKKDTINTFSEADGSFTFSGIIYSEFTLAFTSVGYIELIKTFRVDKALTTQRLGRITMIPFAKILDEVVVKNSLIVIKTDTIEYRAGIINLKQDAFVEDLLKKLPGIQVTRNGIVTAHGKQVSRIKINGKDFFGGNIKATTQELPANIIDKVQVIDDYGETANVSGIKTGEPDKVINLQLKKEKRNGMFGKAEAGYGTSDSYKASLSTNYFKEKNQLSVIGRSNNINSGFVITGTGNANISGMMNNGNMTTGGIERNANNINASMYEGMPGSLSGLPQGITTSHSIGTNFRSDFAKKNSFYGSYDLGQQNTNGYRDITGRIFYPGTSYLNNQHFAFNKKSNHHQAYINLELYLDTFTYLRISPSLYYNKNKNSSTSKFEYLKDAAFKTTEGFTHDTTNNNALNFGVNILYNRGFRKKGRNLALSLYQNFSNIHSESTRFGITRSFETQGGNSDVYQNQKFNQDSKSQDYNLDVAYTEPLSKNRFIDFTYFHNFSKSSNHFKTFENDLYTGIDSLLPDISNQLTSRYTNERVGLNIRTVTKSYNYTLGVNILPVSVENYSDEKNAAYNHTRILNFAPSAKFTGIFSGTKSMSITYNGDSRQPSYKQLQPVIDVSNAQYQHEGNPELKPEFFHNLNMSYNNFNLLTSGTFFTGLNVNLVQNKIVKNTILLDSTGAQITKPENVSGGYSLSGFYTVTKPYQQNRYTISLNGSLNYNHDPILVNNRRVNNKNWFLLQELLFNYNYKSVEFSAGGKYCLSASQSLLNQPVNINLSTWLLSHDMRIDLPGKLSIKYTCEYFINNGLTASPDKNIIFLNSIIEKKVSKTKPYYVSIGGYNILDQNSSYRRLYSANSVMDVRSLQLNRYFLVTFLYRWNKFTSK